MQNQAARPGPTRVVVLLFPQVTQLDFTGPAQVFGRMPNTEVILAWHTVEPIVTDCGWKIVPTCTLRDCPQADVLFVPGGDGAFTVMEDLVALDFLRQQAKGARWVTSVCTGSFALAAAGLLKGYRATTHWAMLDRIEQLGVVPVSSRVVMDRNRITGAGVTSGIDFALCVAAALHGVDVAKEIQLGLEYDPQPPFRGGSPARAEPEVVAAVMESNRQRRAVRQQIIERVLARAAPPE